MPSLNRWKFHVQMAYQGSWLSAGQRDGPRLCAQEARCQERRHRGVVGPVSFRRRVFTVHAAVSLTWRAIALLACIAVCRSASSEQRGLDCPLALKPNSASLDVLDLLNNPATKAVLERDAPELTAHPAAAILLNPTPPSFSDIVTPIILRDMGLLSSDALARLDADLRAVPLKPADSLRRCARYDEAPPALPLAISHPALLVFTKINGFRDDPSVAAAAAALEKLSARHGWTTVFTDNGAVFNAKDLSRFDAVVWNNVSGDALTLTQERAFKVYIERGGGFAGFHGSGGDYYYAWDWYADTLLGARFLGHPMSPQFQAARVIVADPQDAIVQGLVDWTMTEEWYSFKSAPRGAATHVLLELDESTYDPVEGSTSLRMGTHPIAWTRCIDDGRAFYSAIGHRPESYAEPSSAATLERGIAWALGQGSTLCHAGREVKRSKSL